MGIRIIVAAGLAIIVATAASAAIKATDARPAAVATVPCSFVGADGALVPCSAAAPLPVGGVQESYQLAAGNTASVPVTLYGGDYVFGQICSGYGTVKLQRLGPDDVTWLDTLAKIGPDTTSGAGVTAGSRAKVRVVLLGTTGCSASISRVPN